MEEKDNICMIPVSATMKKIDGKWVMASPKWAAIPAEDVVAELVKRGALGMLDEFIARSA